VREGPFLLAPPQSGHRSSCNGLLVLGFSSLSLSLWRGDCGARAGAVATCSARVTLACSLIFSFFLLSSPFPHSSLSAWSSLTPASLSVRTTASSTSRRHPLHPNFFWQVGEAGLSWHQGHAKRSTGECKTGTPQLTLTSLLRSFHRCRCRCRSALLEASLMSSPVPVPVTLYSCISHWAILICLLLMSLAQLELGLLLWAGGDRWHYTSIGSYF
jgi:hypothetical protein